MIIYTAKRNVDLCEGRGPMVTIAHFTSRTDAVRAAKGYGWPDGEVNDEILFNSFNEYYEGLAKDKQAHYNKYDPVIQQKIKDIQSKLTKEELDIIMNVK